MTIARSPSTGLVEVDGVPWTDRQVRQAREDARACMESRGAYLSPSVLEPPRFRTAKPCDCVCCRIYVLTVRGGKT